MAVSSLIVRGLEVQTGAHLTIELQLIVNAHHTLKPAANELLTT